jgi:hypothetical protein
MIDKLERKAVVDAVLNLFDASKTASLLLPIPNTNPPVYVVAGELGEIEKMIEIERAIQCGVQSSEQFSAKQQPDSTTEINTDERNRFWTVIGSILAVGGSLLGILFKFKFKGKKQ